jgi:uncharacterized protein (TIGR02246 family)
MGKISILRRFACVLAALPLLAQGAGPADESAIREVVKNYVEARDRKDAQAIESLFTNDADQLVSSGEWRKGRTEVVKGTLASSQGNAGKRTIAVEAVRFIGNDVALADGRYEIAGGPGGETRKMWTSLILKRDPSGWHIAAIRNMLPSPSR